MLPKISAYVKMYDGLIKRIPFLIEDDDLLEKYNTILDKVGSDIKKNDREPVYNEEYLKTKIKSHGDEVTDFPKVESNHTSLAVISLCFALNKEANYYPQTFLKERKDIEKNEIGHINENLTDFSSDDDSDEK